MLVCGIFAKLSIQPHALCAGGAYRKVLCSKTEIRFHVGVWRIAQSRSHIGKLSGAPFSGTW